MSKPIAAVLTLALVLAPLAAGPARAQSELERALVESAATPAQHAALARFYESKAAAARKEAEQHRAMGKAYAGGKAADTLAMRDHCDKLAALYDQQAEQFDLLAQAQAKLAK